MARMRRATIHLSLVVVTGASSQETRICLDAHLSKAEYRSGVLQEESRVLHSDDLQHQKDSFRILQ